MSAQNLSALLQSSIVTLFTSMRNLKNTVKDISNIYWKTDVSTTISGLADGDCVGVNSKITKAQMVLGLTMSEELADFFGNAAVSQADYLGTCEKLKYGNGTLATIRSVATEALADMLKQLGVDIIELYQDCLDILSMYTENEFGDILAVMDTERIVYGSDMTKSELSAAITLVEQFKKLVNNEAVTTGNYFATLSKWERLS